MPLSKDEILRWVKDHGRLPSQRDPDEVKMFSRLHYLKRNDEAFSKALEPYKSKPGRGSKKYHDELNSLALFLIESGGTGFYV